MDFTAIDFETANQRRDSACQLAAVVVQEGEIVDRQMWLIRPRPFFFSHWNVQIHGIHPERVAAEPEFGELWPTIAGHLGSACLVAHNAPFDIGVLLACLRAHDHWVPEIDFTCTRLIARAAWPGRSGYGLKPIANWLGIDFQHHDALEDSTACARILLAAAAKTGATSLRQLEHQLKLSRGHADGREYQGPKRSRGTKKTVSAGLGLSPSSGPCSPSTSSPPEPLETILESGLDVQRLFVRAEFLRRLIGKQVVFSGRCQSLSHQHAEQLAIKLGATIERHVTHRTDYVIVGELHDPVDVHSPSPQAPELSRARELNLAGHSIGMLSESDFIGMVQCSHLTTST